MEPIDQPVKKPRMKRSEELKLLEEIQINEPCDTLEKPKKPRTQKQIDAFERCREARKTKATAKKAQPKEQEPEDELKYEEEEERPQAPKKQYKPRASKAQPQYEQQRAPSPIKYNFV
jgi:hypothetical protein